MTERLGRCMHIHTHTHARTFVFDIGGLGNFLFSTASRPALGLTQPPTQWVPGVKRPEREADRSPPFSAEVKVCVELYHHPNTSSWRGA
jgi:hypothetical protein